MLKRVIRVEYIDRRLNLSEKEIAGYNNDILNYFKKIHLPSCDYLLSFYPLKERNEFDNSACEKHLLSLNPLMKTGWPRIDESKIRMEAYPVDAQGIFAKNRFNILEPISGEPIPPEKFDIVFVPLVIFDKQGYRVGYGKGYYDRYLTQCRKDTLKIGFSFFDPIDAIRDISEFDVPLDICITPARIYEF